MAHQQNVALLVSGMFRKAELGLENQIDTIVKPLNCDVFAHIWKQVDIEHNRIVKEEEVEKIFGLKDFVIEDNFAVKETYKKQNKSFNCMLYKIQKSFEIMEAYEKQKNMKYDLVIRTRSDCYYRNKLELPNILEDKVIYCPAGQTNFKHGFNDQIFYGLRDTMKIACFAYDGLEGKEYNLRYNEEIYRKFLQEQGVEIKVVNTPLGAKLNVYDNSIRWDKVLNRIRH